MLMLILLALPAAGVLPPPPARDGGPLPDWDVRGTEALDREAAPTAGQLRALADLAKDIAGQPPAVTVPDPAPGLVVRWGPQPGTLHQLFYRNGFLTAEKEVTGKTPVDYEAIALRFLSRYRALFGFSEQGVKDLVEVRRMVDPGSKAVHLLFEQRVEGVEIFLGLVQVHLDRRGSILAVGGNTAPDKVVSAQTLLSASDALVAAANSVRVPIESAPPVTRIDDEECRTRFARGPFETEPWVDPAWFPYDSGIVRAWRVIVDPAEDQGWYQVVVDAASGEIFSRCDLTDNIATQGLVFREDPGRGPQVLLPLIDDAVLTDPASPLGWTKSGESEGNNCDVKDDKANDDEATIGTRAVATGPDPLSFSFPFTDNPGNDLEASITNLFYLNNWLHDRLLRLGFDEAAGNFQDDNFGLGGKGGDRVLVDAQDGGGYNNANFGTPPDGSSPRMQMYVWTFTNPARDAGFDSSVITHELFHGVSNRLVSGGGSVGCLGGAHGGAMGEGWSDFFPCSFWDTPTVGGYVVNDNAWGIRRAPYDSYPYDYGQLCNQGGFEVHRDGEIWAAILWDLRKLFIERYGYQEGKCKVERLVLDGMKLSPCRPAYIDMRDAILQAAELHGASGDACLLWKGFAARGLGIDAVRAEGCTAGQNVTSYDIPPECADCSLAPPSAVAADTSLPNEVTVRFTPSPGADEHVLLRASAPCPAQCLDAEFVEAARGPADATQLRDADADANRLSAGQTYAYRVMALKGTACTAASACAEATVTGRCTLRPEPVVPGAVGVNALSRPPLQSCNIVVGWAEAEAVCNSPGGLHYNIYRSEDPAFVPGVENLIASVPAPTILYLDGAVPPLEVTYVVRAEDTTSGGSGPHGGNEESNDVRLSLAPQGPVSGTTTFTDDGESGELPGYRRTGTFKPNDWQIVSDADTRGGSAWHVTGQEGGTADKNLEMPPLSLGSNPRLSFAHIFDFEDYYDGGVIEISTDRGLTWTDLLDDFTAGGYSTSRGAGISWTVESLIHPPNTNQVWNGQNASRFGNYDAVAVDLAPYAGTLDAVLRFRCLLDPMTAEPGGWYIDDIVVEDALTFDACQSACTSPPQAVLPDGTFCAPDSNPAEVALDGSGSIPGAAGFAAELSHVFTHEGPGSFAGSRWAEGPLATLTFPVGTAPGDYAVTLTVRGADTCSDEVTAKVTLVPEAMPPGTVGNTLRVVRDPAGLSLTWVDVGASSYNAHIVPAGSDLSNIHLTKPEKNVAATTALLDSGLALPGAGTAFIKVYSASTCGKSVP
jgi:hypothetical protein